MNKRLAVLAGAMALSVVPLTAQAQETPATTQMMPAAECGEHHSDPAHMADMNTPGHIGRMASSKMPGMGGQHIAEHARGEHHMHVGEIASRPGQIKSGRLSS